MSKHYDKKGLRNSLKNGFYRYLSAISISSNTADPVFVFQLSEIEVLLRIQKKIYTLISKCIIRAFYNFDWQSISM